MATSLNKAQIILRGGMVVDGTGTRAFKGDVALGHGRILAVGDLGKMQADIVHDISGLYIAPGFIDVHTHDDLACLATPDMTPKISQGVTSVIVGNCGISAVPLTFQDGPSEPFNLLGGSDEFRFPKFAAYADALAAQSPRVNVGVLIGHSSLRVTVMEDLDRPANNTELGKMSQILKEAIEDGALGLSSGVFYAPSAAADLTELTGLASIVASAGGVYTAHVRDEYDGVAESLKEAFAVCSRDKVPLVLSHHKCAGVRNWGRATETLSLIDDARTRQPVFLDCYPYTAGSTVLREDLADGEIEVLVNWSEPHPEMAGRTLKSIAADWQCSEGEVARRLAPGGASYFQIHEDDMRKIISHCGCMVGSDGLPNDPLPHPRLWGTFPRVLGRYVRELGLLSLEAAVHKMSGLSAATFGLTDRGIIAPGMAADLTVFDPASVLDRATYAEPQQMSAGIRMVFVNGQLSWRDQEIVGGRHGQMLKRSGQTSSAKITDPIDAIG